MVSVRWVPLLEDFAACRRLSWGSAVLSYTYHHLCMTADQGTTDIAGCVPLIMSLIYQRFPTFCPEARDVIVFPLVSSNVNYMTMVFKLTGYQQMNRDSHERRMVQIRSQLDRLGVHKFAFTPYDDWAWDAL
ncbi:hypothetical protein PIB30_000699 [Stylosanthes scabra]|uniref:Aminotransferase-like plant mobile domain-containing protein n=1 Tax=Stylosanthes scabra TaxID=79078 RepID=A0ABU6Z4H6_9FABA|nr:hypothetical protein [Stylosanthes scabra]